MRNNKQIETALKNLGKSRPFRFIFDKKYCSYLKMRRRHKKALVKLAKQGEDFDWGYLHDMIVQYVKNFLEYYELGNNVWQTEETRQEIIESLRESVRLSERIKNNREWASEDKLYGDFYSHLAQNILKWWD